MIEQEMSNIETFEEFCKNNRCSNCRFEKFATIDGCSDCEKHFMKEHDFNLLDKVAVRIKLEMIETYPENIYGNKVPTPFAHFSYTDVCNIVDKVIVEKKAEVSE